MVSVTSEIFTENTLYKNADGTISNGVLKDTYYRFDTRPINLMHDKEWSVEWTSAGGDRLMLLVANNEYKVAKPDLEPYKIVYASLEDALERLEVYSGDSTVEVANIRPYLQDFTASWLGAGNYVTYSTKQVTAQIQASYDLGLNDFTLWDPSNKYCYDAIKNVK
jgi:hypothetical protein